MGIRPYGFPMFKWAARFSTIMSLSPRLGFLGKAAMMGVFGGGLAVVIGAFTGTQKLMGPLSYVFLAALGGALGMVLWSVRESSPRIWTCNLAKFWRTVHRAGGAPLGVLCMCL
jgi:hypothetical protein